MRALQSLFAAALWLLAAIAQAAPDAASAPAARAPAARVPAPLDEGFRIPGSFEPIGALWLGFDRGHAPWTAAMVAALKPHVPLRFLVRDEAVAQQARDMLHDHGIDVEGLRFHIDPQAAFFVQDAAVFAVDGQGRSGVVDLKWSGHGMAAWCQRRYAADADHAAACADSIDRERDTLSRTIAAFAGARVITTELRLEGGGVEVNGRGVMIANEALLRSRNPGLGRAELQRLLLQLPGVRKVVWLPEGPAEDPHLRSTITGRYVGWGTGGHTDQFVRFADPGTVLLAWVGPAQAAAHPVARLTRKRMQRNLEILQRATDLDGRPFRIVKVPMPHTLQRPVVLSADADTLYSEQWRAEDLLPTENRHNGDTVIQVAPASYLNYVAANGVVLVPDYAGHGTPASTQNKVRAIFERSFPGRRIVFVDSAAANWYAGGPHCATLSQPAGH
ncbi:MAG: agmatine deiminase family protein [Burkholderiaceae bacterium]|nr:agmatine deiminase family protein [Burkholderiaceae bacterium]